MIEEIKKTNAGWKITTTEAGASEGARRSTGTSDKGYGPPPIPIQGGRLNRVVLYPICVIEDAGYSYTDDPTSEAGYDQPMTIAQYLVDHCAGIILRRGTRIE